MTQTVDTTRFGSIEIETSSVIEFPEGLLGFGDCKRYVLLDHPGGSGPFEWLQSLERPEIAFCVIDPTQFKPDYRIAVKQHELSGIRIKSIEDGVVRVILVIPRGDPMSMTANLQGPLVINKKEMLARQLVLGGGQYPTRFRVFPDQTEPEQAGDDGNGSNVPQSNRIHNDQTPPGKAGGES